MEASIDDITARIEALHNDPSSWYDPSVRPRASLAGQQGKFSLSRIGDAWFWPSYSAPSTHIFKPPFKKWKRLAWYEHGAMSLARAAGIPTVTSEVASFLDRTTFVTGRWDRSGTRRLHAEDLAQALGVGVDRKYRVRASQVVRLLTGAGADPYDFVGQFAFNVFVGNADAHAKNYSVLLDGDQVRLAPLYDVVPTFLFAGLDRYLAMEVDGVRTIRDTSPKRWAAFAVEAGLDAGEVCRIADEVRAFILENFTSHVLIDEVNSQGRTAVRKHLRTLEHVGRSGR